MPIVESRADTAATRGSAQQGRFKTNPGEARTQGAA